MRAKTVLLGAAACIFLGGTALAQTTDSAPSQPVKKHRHAASGLEQRLDRMEKIIEQQQSEIRDLRAKVGQANASGGASSTSVAAAPPSQPQVTASDFQALQNQVNEQASQTKTLVEDEKNGAAVTLNYQKTPKDKGLNKSKCPSSAKNIWLCRPTIATRDDKYSMSFTTLVQADAATFDKSDVVGAKGTTVPSHSGFNFRRVQFGIQGTIADDFGYKLNYDFGGAGGQESGQTSIITNTTPPVVADSPSGARVQSAYVTYRGILDPFYFKIGAFPTPTNLNDATASEDLLLNERPSPAQVSRSLDGDDGRDGVGFQGNGDIWYFSSYLTSDTFGKGQITGQEAYVGRVAIAPIQDKDTNFNVHLGGNLGDVFHPQGLNPASCTTTAPACYLTTFSDRPELREWNVSWINTGGINSTSAYSAGIEAAISYGPFLLEGENFWYGLDRRDPAPGATNPNFSGWYIEGSWVMTGEPRTYSMANASFTRPVPVADFDPAHDAWGAWELAARYSDTDLNYNVNSLVSADQVHGGDQQIYSAGLNFYPSYNLKFMLDWQNIDIRRPWTGAFDTKYNAFSLRAQFAL